MPKARLRSELAFPGRVNGWTGEVLSGGYLDLSGADVKGEIAKAFSKPVAVVNDCGMALVAEARLGAGRGFKNIAMLTIGTGIGGALMESGRLVNGKRCAGQLGHIIVNVDGHLLSMRPARLRRNGIVRHVASTPSIGSEL